MNTKKIQQQLDARLRDSIKLHEREDGIVMVDNPFTFPDGDSFSLYLSPTEDGGYKLSDLGNVVMRLSYNESIDKYFDNDMPQGKSLSQILRKTNVSEEDGEFYVASTLDSLADDILTFSQALTQIYDLRMIGRERYGQNRNLEAVAETGRRRTKALSVLLKEAVQESLPESHIKPKYYFGCDKHKKYPTDYYLHAPNTRGKGVCLYGISSAAKAKDVTIVLQYLQQHNERHKNLLVLPDDERKIGKIVQERLYEASGEEAIRIRESGAIKDAIRQHVY